MSSQREKENSKKWADHILEKYSIWSERLTDTPYISEGGIVNYKKPFDRIVVIKGFAIEFKYVKGRGFNLKKWITHKDTRHQYTDLLEFSRTKSGIGVLFIFFKMAGKRDLQKRWISAISLKNKFINENKTHIKYDEMKDVIDLEKMIGEIDYGH